MDLETPTPAGEIAPETMAAVPPPTFEYLGGSIGPNNVYACTRCGAVVLPPQGTKHVAYHLSNDRVE